MTLRLLLLALLLLTMGSLAYADSSLLCGFETKAGLAAPPDQTLTGELSDQHVTEGSHSFSLPVEETLSLSELPKDWSGYEAVELDVYLEAPVPYPLRVEIRDAAWQTKPTYWNSFRAEYGLRPGANTIAIPVTGLYRGEMGSRYNDLKTAIDPKQIVQVLLAFDSRRRRDTKAPRSGARVYLDNLRLTKASRPAGVFAFDFGPVDQAVAPGFTPISPESAYSETVGWGWQDPKLLGPAWDVTFPTRLLQDSIDIGKATFRVKVAPGKYHVMVFFEDLGYWDGEAAQFTRRVVCGHNWQQVQERKQWGKLDYVYRFEDREPQAGGRPVGELFGRAIRSRRGGRVGRRRDVRLAGGGGRSGRTRRAPRLCARALPNRRRGGRAVGPAVAARTARRVSHPRGGNA